MRVSSLNLLFAISDSFPRRNESEQNKSALLVQQLWQLRYVIKSNVFFFFLLKMSTKFNLQSDVHAYNIVINVINFLQCARKHGESLQLKNVIVSWLWCNWNGILINNGRKDNIQPYVPHQPSAALHPLVAIFPINYNKWNMLCVSSDILIRVIYRASPLRNNVIRSDACICEFSWKPCISVEKWIHLCIHENICECQRPEKTFGTRRLYEYL